MDVMASPTRDNKQKSNLPSTSSPAKELSKSTSDVTQSQSRDRRYSFSSEDILALEMQVRRQSSGHHLTTVRSGSFHGSSPPSRQNSQPSSPRSTMRSGSFNEAKVRSPRENEVPSLVPVKTIYNNTPLNDKLLNRRRYENYTTTVTTQLHLSTNKCTLCKYVFPIILADILIFLFQHLYISMTNIVRITGHLQMSTNNI